MQRSADITRTTKETAITLSLSLEGTGLFRADYPVGFMAHMLHIFAGHGLFDISVKAAGDLEVDQHHLIEDTGIALGQAFAQALGDKRGIRRSAACLYPMDETLSRVAVDLCGRAFLVFEAGLSGIPLVSAAASFQTDTVADFWEGFTRAAGCVMHMDILRGRSDHHKIEALFKAAARALREACEPDPRALDRVPSTKGILDKDGIMLC